MKRTMVVGLGALAILILGACSNPDSLREEREDAQREVFDERFQESQAATPGPDETPDPNAPIVNGLPVGDYYAAACVACHGANREGGVGLPLTPDALTEPDDFYIETIKNGRDGTLMQPYGGQPPITDEELAVLVEWLKTSAP